MAESQKEFFDEFTELGKGRGKSFQRPEPKKNFLSYSLESLLLGILLLVMGGVIVYATGFEMGRREAFQSLEKNIQKEERPAASKPSQGVRHLSTAQTEKTKKKFTIQVASFENTESATRALEALKKEKGNIQAFLIPGLTQIAVCVGTYEKRADADQALTELRRTHHDSFVRNL